MLSARALTISGKTSQLNFDPRDIVRWLIGHNLQSVHNARRIRIGRSLLASAAARAVARQRGSAGLLMLSARRAAAVTARHHPRQRPADADRDPRFSRRRAERQRDRAAALPRSSPPTSSAAACSRRSIPPPSSRKSPTSTRCRAFPIGAPSTRRRLSPAASRGRADGRLKAEFRLWDVLAGQQLAGQQYFTTPDNWRRIAHIISDAIYERLTGEKGYFDSRVVFVDETGRRSAASSGSPSWIRTAPTCAISRAATISC